MSRSASGQVNDGDSDRSVARLLNGDLDLVVPRKKACDISLRSAALHRATRWVRPMTGQSALDRYASLNGVGRNPARRRWKDVISREGWGAVTAVPEPDQLPTTRAKPGLEPFGATVTALFSSAFQFSKLLNYIDLLFYHRNSRVCYWGTVELRSWNSKTNRWNPHGTRAPRASEKAVTEITVSPGPNIKRG